MIKGNNLKTLNDIKLTRVGYKGYGLCNTRENQKVKNVYIGNSYRCFKAEISGCLFMGMSSIFIYLLKCWNRFEVIWNPHNLNQDEIHKFNLCWSLWNWKIMKSMKLLSWAKHDVSFWNIESVLQSFWSLALSPIRNILNCFIIFYSKSIILSNIIEINFITVVFIEHHKD